MYACSTRSFNVLRQTPVVAAGCLILACTLAFALLYAGAQPVAAGLIPTPWDKVAHFAVYTAITALLLLGTRLRWPLTTLGLVCVLGACDELLQLSLPGRSADLADWLTDIAAGVVTCAVLLAIHHRNSSGRRDAHPATPSLYLRSR